MGQPITIYRGNDVQTVYGKAQLDVMIADGWSLEQPRPKAKPKPARKRTAKKASTKGS